MTDATEPRKVLVLGASGMLGHRVCIAASEAADLDAWATVRATDPGEAHLPAAVIDPSRLLGGLDAAVRPDRGGCPARRAARARGAGRGRSTPSAS